MEAYIIGTLLALRDWIEFMMSIINYLPAIISQMVMNFSPVVQIITLESMMNKLVKKKFVL